MYFKQGLYAGKRGRYGLAEGPEGKWCDEGKAYHSMSLHEKIHAVTPGVRTGMIIGASSHCEAISGNVVAGYLPANPEMIYDLRGTAEHLAIGLLYRVMRHGRLDYRLACVFRDAGHSSIADAISSLDLLAGMPTHNALGNRNGGCRW